MKILNSFLNFYNFVISIIIIIYGFFKKSIFLVKIADATNELRGVKKMYRQNHSDFDINSNWWLFGENYQLSRLHEIRSIQDLYIK
jgi:hypothetical protein